MDEHTIKCNPETRRDKEQVNHIKTGSGSAKGDSATIRTHPAIHYLPQKGKNQGIRDCV